MTSTIGGRTLEDLSVGQTAERSFTVAASDIDAFAAVSHDHNPVHVDEAYAVTTPFKSRIAHGVLSVAYISAVLGESLPGSGAVYVSQTARFKRPVEPGDQLIAQALAQCRDRGRHVPLGAQDCRGGCNPWERQALGVG